MMPVYHFIFNISCEIADQEALIKSKASYRCRSLIIVRVSCEKAFESANEHIENRLSFTGRLSDYELSLEWIDDL